MARAKRRPSALEQRANKAGQQLGKDWAALTWNKDRGKIGPLPIVAWNLVIVAVLGALLWFAPLPRLWVAAALAAFLAWTVMRAGAVMPARRKALNKLFEALRSPAALPRGSTSSPVDPEGYIKVSEWGRNTRPARFTLTIGAESKAAKAQPLRQVLEKAIEKAAETPRPGQEWIFTWRDGSHVECRAVASDDPRVWQRNHDRKMINALCQRNLFDGAANAEQNDYELTVVDRTESTKKDITYHFPTKVTFTFGGFDAADPMFRSRVTDTFDRTVRGPGVWVYDWSEDGQLTLELVDDNDVRAQRKKEEGKLVADCYNLVGNKRGLRLQVDVEKWMAEGKAFPPHFPIRIRVDFGTLNLGDRRDRDDFENRFDTAVESRYDGLVWLYDWKPGASTVLDAKAVKQGSRKSLEKAAEKRYRNVIETKFKERKNFVDCDILEWREKLADDGTAVVQKAEVKFGSIDVTDNDLRDKFQEHWESLTDATDFHYYWDAPSGKVTITAVPALPSAIMFPEVGTPEFEEAIELAKKGILRFGPQKGGGWVDWDMNETPHGLFGGKTGMGKSVALSIVLFYAIYLPDYFEVIVCDPKMTDFTWTPEFPSVIKFACTDVEICEACGYAREQMNARQKLLNKTGVRKLSQLRKKIANNPELANEYGPVPKRLILFFDEIADFLAPGSDEDLEELKKVAAGDLESIARLGRAPEVNIDAAAQKPDAKIMSTQLRSQLGFRLGVGPLDQYESQQILNSDHGTRFPESGTPKGRAWAYDPKGGYRQVQVMFLPDETDQNPLDPTQTVTGAQERARDRLRELGFHPVERDNGDRGKQVRWVTVEMEDETTDSGSRVDADDRNAALDLISEVETVKAAVLDDDAEATAEDANETLPVSSPERSSSEPSSRGRTATRAADPAAAPAPEPAVSGKTVDIDWGLE